MKRILITTTAIIALMTSAFAAGKETYQSNTKITKDATGNFNEKNTIIKTGMDGTITSFEKNISIDVESNGDFNKTTTTESVRDAKGTGNKHVTKTKDTENSKNGEVSTTHEASVDGKSVADDSSFEKNATGNYERNDTIIRTDAEGTTRSSEKNLSVKVDSNGNATKTTSTEKTTDPEGPGNKTSVKITDTKKTTDDAVTTTHEKKVNGAVVDKKIETKSKY